MYAGFAIDVQARLDAHCRGNGAPCTRTRRPLRRAYKERVRDWSVALKRELAIRDEKLGLIRRTRRC